MRSITIPEETDISRGQWQQAWHPTDILVRYFVAGCILAGVLLLPLASSVSWYSLIVVSFPVIGLLLGLVVWRRSYSAVNDAYRDVLDGICDWDCRGETGVEIFVSAPTGTGQQYQIEPAEEYALFYVEVTDRYTLLEEITVDFVNLELSAKSESVPRQQIASQSFESGVFSLDTSKGSWRITGLENVSSDEVDHTYVQR